MHRMAASDLIVDNSKQHDMTYIIIDIKLNESLNRNLTQNKQICFDFMVALIFDHCDCREFNDRRIPCAN